MTNPFVDHRGTKVGKLTVISQVASHPTRGRQWFCRCDCGGGKVVTSTEILNARVKSCGCLHPVEGGRKPRTGRKDYHTPLYRAWARMKAKCLIPTALNYQYFGGKGIGIAPEWVNSFDAFKAWAEAAGYAKGHVLARRDRDKGFSPENCFWSKDRPSGSGVTVSNRAVIRSDGVRFYSIGEAVRATPGTISSGITAVCRGRGQSHIGFGWRYADEEA